MDNILKLIANATEIRVAKSKERLPLEKLEEKIYEKYGKFKYKTSKLPDNLTREAFPFEKALKKPGISFICEVKKASPSKGIIDPIFPYIWIAREYEEAGADAISVLTEPDYFQGDNRHLSDIRKNVSLPVLRKDFTIDEYQIYEAKYLGANAVLLICALLNEDKLKAFISLCDKLNLSALVEAHTEEEIKTALRSGARIIGINNRDLNSFRVDVNNSVRLRKLVPEEVCFVAESGIKTRNDILKLQDAKADAVLIGESLMRSPDKKKMLLSLRGEQP